MKLKIRTGIGYDVHQLAENEELIIGGVKIPHTKGTIAHSDGDVLIHAICDALLGAASLRDIGYHFPDNSPEYKGIDSKILLRRTVESLKAKGYTIGNIDSVVCLQRPKIKDYIEQMRSELAKVIACSTDDISIKATTTEKLGFVGDESGIAAYATVLIFNDNND